MVDVTLIRPLNKVKVHWSSSSAFCTDETAGRSYNEDKIAMPPDLVSGTVYLLSCELQMGSEIFNGECDAMIE